METANAESLAQVHARADLRSIGRSIDIDIDIEDRRQIEEKEATGLSAYGSLAALVDALVMELGFASVEARHICAVFGAIRCEGALVKTLWDIDAGGIRKPRGWFLGALKEGKEWAPEDVKTHLAWLQREEVRRAVEAGDVHVLAARREELRDEDLELLAASSNPQLQRLAREEGERRAENVRQIGARRKRSA